MKLVLQWKFKKVSWNQSCNTLQIACWNMFHSVVALSAKRFNNNCNSGLNVIPPKFSSQRGNLRTETIKHKCGAKCYNNILLRWLMLRLNWKLCDIHHNSGSKCMHLITWISGQSQPVKCGNSSSKKIPFYKSTHFVSKGSTFPIVCGPCPG